MRRATSSGLRTVGICRYMLSSAGAKFWIPSPEELENYGGRSAVKLVGDGILGMVPLVPLDGTLLRERSRPEVYVGEGRKAVWVDPDKLDQYGGLAKVRVIPDGALARNSLKSMPDGVDETNTA
jgi:hypothetical protein